MKKFINDVALVEDQMIQGMVKAYPGYLRKLDCGNVVVRANKKEGKVALISGGGSGHEPAHGGYVGCGMLDAAVAGAVFTSPTPVVACFAVFQPFAVAKFITAKSIGL